MGIDFHSTVLITDRFDRMKDFYCRILCRKVRFDFGSCVTFDCGLTIWQLKPGHPVARALGEKRFDECSPNLELCFETDVFDREVDYLKSQEVLFLHDVTEEAWGQMTVRFFDPDRNLVELGESMPAFCKRLHASGLSLNETAQKTGIALDDVKRFISADA